MSDSRPPLVCKNTSDGSEWQTLTLSGSIDEYSQDGLALISTNAAPKCRLDLGGIVNFNSSGVRIWMLFLRQLVAGRQIILDRCSPAFVAQLALIPDIAKGCQVTSGHVHFACDACQNQTYILLSSSDARDPGHLDIRCSRCGEKMEYDEDDSFRDYLELSGAG